MLLTVTLAGYLVFLVAWVRFHWWLAGRVGLESEHLMRAANRKAEEMPPLITITRHGHEVRFPEVPGAAATPYMYQPFRDGRWYEETFLEHIRRAGRQGVYVDVGANVGTATSWFAVMCPSTHVHAVEPVGRFADQIERVVKENQLGGKVTLHRVGLSDRAGVETNHLDQSHQVGFDANPEARDETFEVTTLDELISDPVAVIKIDVEGMEAKVLKGATRILERDKPVVYFEAFDRGAMREVAAVLALFGYGPTGQVFNATPTYEFSTEAHPGAGLRVAAYQANHTVRRKLWKIAKKAGIR